VRRGARHVATVGDLAKAWTVRTLRARYQQSVLGWSWAVIQPIATVAVFTIVFTRFVRIDTGGVPYIVFAYTALVPWTLLATALPDMATSLVSNFNLVSKIYFPREALPIAALAARLVDFGISIILLAVLVVAFHTHVSPPWVLFLPVILLIQLALILGLGLGSAALNVFYRDVDPVLKLLLQLWFYASPIIYPASLVPQRWQWLYFANPMAGIIESYRDVLLAHEAPGWYLVPAAFGAVLLLVTGYGFFRRVEGRFADVI